MAHSDNENKYEVEFSLKELTVGWEMSQQIPQRGVRSPVTEKGGINSRSRGQLCLWAAVGMSQGCTKEVISESVLINEQVSAIRWVSDCQHGNSMQRSMEECER